MPVLSQINVTDEQLEFLKLLIHEDAASSIGGTSAPGNSIQWCIDACMKIEKLYGIDACYVAYNDVRLPENNESQPQGQSEAVAFAEWLNQNRWFNYDRDNKVWCYTFEQGTAMSRAAYLKNYTKTSDQLYSLFKQSQTPSPISVEVKGVEEKK